MKNERETLPVNRSQLNNQSFIDEKLESKDVLEEKLKDIKNSYEGRMTGLRDDIYKKERDIYDLKNQINLINMRLSKEGDAKKQADDALKKNNERFSHDATKFSASLKNVNRENEGLVGRLQETEKTIYREETERRDLEVRLKNLTEELEQTRGAYAQQNDEKNRRIHLLNAELKELQERFNEQNVRNSVVDGKNSELAENLSKIRNENEGLIFRLEKENERLSREHEELSKRTGVLTNDTEGLKNTIEVKSKELAYARNNCELTIQQQNSTIRDAQVKNARLDDELKNLCRKKYADESRDKDEKLEFEREISENKFNLNKAEAENEDLIRKLDQNDRLYREAYEDNEKILNDFESLKDTQQRVQHDRDNEITNLKKQRYTLENYIGEANNKIGDLESNISQGEVQYAEMKEQMNRDINSMLDKNQALKVRYDDVTLTLRTTQDKLLDRRAVNQETEQRIRSNCEDLNKEIALKRDDNDKKHFQIQTLEAQIKKLTENIADLNSINRRAEDDTYELKNKHDRFVTEASDKIRQLEKDNYEGTNTKDALEEDLFKKTSENRGLELEFKNQKESALKREKNMNDTLNRLELELCREKEVYRDLIGQNTLLNNQYEDSVKNKESQAKQIHELRQSHLGLEDKIRKVQRDFIEKDSETASKLAATHTARRAEHIDSIKNMIETLKGNLKKVTELQDLEQVDELISHYKQRIDDIEGEIEEKDSELEEIQKDNHDTAVDVDLKRNARSDFETKNMDLVEMRSSYDRLLLEHNRLKGNNQGLECELREANAELRTAVETQHKEEYAMSPLKKVGSTGLVGDRDRFGSGNKLNGSGNRHNNLNVNGSGQRNTINRDRERDRGSNNKY